jgi:hypothetical protein
MVGLGDLQAAMDQGGWLDVRSVMGYSRDVPDRHRAVVAAMPAPDSSPVDTRPRKVREKSFGGIDL